MDSCVFLIFTTRVDQTNGSTLLKLILFEKSRVEFFNLYDKSPETLWELRSIRASHRVSKQKLMDRKTHALGVRACVPRPRLRTREMRWTRLWALVIGVLLLPLATAYTCEWHCLMLLASTRARWACETPARCSAWTCGKAEIPLVCFYAQSGGPMTYAARSALSRYRWWWSRKCQ